MDYISNLPDEIISHILSFLSTVSAVKTCILSKRWQYLWTNVPALDFNDSPPYFILSDNQKSYLMNFVSRLQCLSQKLVVLKLTDFSIDNVGHSFHLPNLEIICFISIRFDGDEFLKSLISGCTALTKLRILGCYGFHKTLYVESSTLESLECQKNFREVMIPLIHIRTPNLRCLNLREAAASYDTGEFNLLTEADLYFRFSENYDDIPYQALQLIKKVSGVKSLRFGSSDMMVCCLANGIPNFKNLIELKIAANLVMYELLESAPKLKSLIIEDVPSVSESFYSKAVPGCMSCLENVEIVIGRDRDHIRLVKHILKVATALKKMKIHVQPDMVRKKRSIQQRLLDFPRSSPICQVELVYY